MTLRMTAETDAPNQDLTYDQNPVLLLIPSNTRGHLYVPEVPDLGLSLSTQFGVALRLVKLFCFLHVYQYICNVTYT